MNPSKIPIDPLESFRESQNSLKVPVTAVRILKNPNRSFRIPKITKRIPQESFKILNDP